MAKHLSNAAAFMVILLLITGMLFCGMPRSEARLHKKHSYPNTANQEQHHINCSSDVHCDPFAAKIDFRCRASGDCQEKCNQFDGVFTCSPLAGFCKCELE